MEGVQNPLQNLEVVGQWAARSPDTGSRPKACPDAPWPLVPRKRDAEDWFYYSFLLKAS